MLKKNILHFLKTKNCISQLYSLLSTSAETATNVAASVKDNLLNSVSEVCEVLPSARGNKVTIVGVGQVGMACAISILTQHISSDICLIDDSEDRLTGELMDLQHGSSFLTNPKIIASTDYADSADSRLCVITAGVRQKEGESRLSLVQRNADAMKQIAPKLVACSPDTTLLVVTNPVDIMTYVAWRTSCLPRNRVIGSGTTLDSARFRYLIAQRLGIAPTSCYGWVIGEHGDSSVPVWSSVNVAGVRLSDLNPNIGSSTDPENWNEVHREVVDSAYTIIKKKGYTSCSIGLCVASLASALISNANIIAPVTTSVMGEHGINEDIFLSLPCALNSNGVRYVVRQILSKTETEQLLTSANIMAERQAELSF